ncbi:MAG: hypothetical protein AAF645_05505 [Myxococcota bacterium]
MNSWTTSLLVCAVGLGASVARAQVSTDEMAARVESDAALVSRVRHVVGPLSLGASVLIAAPAIAAWADGAYEDRPNVGFVAAGVAALGVFQGVVWLAIETAAEERAERFRRECDGGCSELELARFEGERRADRAIARMERALIMWSGIGLMFGGTLHAAIQSQAELPRVHRALGYAGATSNGLIGLGLLIRSFIPLRRERRDFSLGPTGDVGLSLGVHF